MDFSKIHLKQYLFRNAVVFAFVGVVWGVLLYLNKPDDFTSPFELWGFVFLSILPAVSLVNFKRDYGLIARLAIEGMTCYVLSLAASFALTFSFLYGAVFILGLLPVPARWADTLFTINKATEVSVFFLEFFFFGLMAGAYYAFVLKRRIVPVMFISGTGFAVGSLIAPSLGNALGWIMGGSLLMKYIMTFALMSACYGGALSFALRQYGKSVGEKIIFGGKISKSGRRKSA